VGTLSLGKGRNSAENVINEELRVFFALLDSGETEATVELRPKIKALVNNILWRVLLGDLRNSYTR